jgi:beta-glucanase (GH16 family)
MNPSKSLIHIISITILGLFWACKPSSTSPTALTSSSSYTSQEVSSQEPSLSSTTLTSTPKWELVWHDEFNGEGLPDSKKWSFEVKPPGWVNNELQQYTGANLTNVRVQDGLLVIEARHTKIAGEDRYTSARIYSQGKGEWLFGRMEARIKLPKGNGTWPAFWMMPTNLWKYATNCSEQAGWTVGCNAWPNSGEIDIMEHIGKDPGNIHASVHSAGYNFMLGNHRTGQIRLTTATDSFHVYAVEWSNAQLDFFVDSIKILTVTNNQSGWQAWPFDQPFYLILNLALGGQWAGEPDASLFTQTQGPKLYVDYVRVYQQILP